MLYLNDDCLLQIFKLLNLKDQINLCQVQERFRLVIVDCIWCGQYKNVTTENRALESLNAEEYLNFFRFNAENIKSLRIEDIRNYDLYGYLHRFTRRPEFSFYFSLKMPNLRSMVCLVNQQRIHDGYIQMLAKYAPSIEELEISSDDITGTAGFQQFHHLKKLYCKSNQKDISDNADNMLLVNLSLSCPKLEIYFQSRDEPCYSRVDLKLQLAEKYNV